jgi:hypothetical protein
MARTTMFSMHRIKKSFVVVFTFNDMHHRDLGRAATKDIARFCLATADARVIILAIACIVVLGKEDAIKGTTFSHHHVSSCITTPHHKNNPPAKFKTAKIKKKSFLGERSFSCCVASEMVLPPKRSNVPRRGYFDEVTE